MPTAQEVYKGTVLRAATFLVGSLSSPIKTHTYFVDPNIGSRYASYPVISIAVDPPLFFSNDNPRGIYVPGPAPNFDPQSPPYFGANFWQDLEVPISIEYFKADRSTAFRVNAGADIAGNISRGFVQKSLDISFRDSYGTKNIDFKLFPDKAITKFKRLRLRNSGSDFGQGQIRDQFSSYVLKDSGLAYRSYDPGVLFINGEYFGLIDIREKDNEDYIESNYGVNADTVDLIDFSNSTREVMNGTATHYDALLQFIANNSLAIPANYAYVKTQMDVDNYAQWFAAEMYVGNWDWIDSGGVNNVRLWRPQTATGRWQWLLHDLDASFYQTDDPAPRFLPNYNMYPQVFGSSSAPGVSDPANQIMVALLQNPDFRVVYLNAVADQLNAYFLKTRTTPLLSTLSARIDPLIPEHFARWRPYGLNGPDGYIYFFQASIARAQQFVDVREGFHVQHTQSFFGVSGRYTLTLNVNDASMGTLKINSLNLSNTLTTTTQPWQGHYFNDVPITVVALPKAGYRFVSWAGANDSTQPTVTLTAANDISLVATFEAVPVATATTTPTPAATSTTIPTATPTETPTAIPTSASQALNITVHIWATGFAPLANWDVSVEDSATGAVQQLATGTDGVATFSIPANPSGTYRICETLKPGWSNSYPGSLCYFQTLSPGNYSYDFVNASDVLPPTTTATPTPTPGATATTPPIATETATPIPPTPTSTPVLPSATPTQAATTVDLTVRVSTIGWLALAGWNVIVTDANNGAELTGTTNALGEVQFALQVGRYQICEMLQANWQNVYPGGLCYYQTLNTGSVSLDFLNASVATATPTPTYTAVPPTATSTPTSSPVPATAIAASTNTPVPPTSTRTPTVTPSTAITVVDNLNNLSQIITFSNPNLFTLESGNASLLGGDPSRLVRTVTTSQWTTWRLDGVRTFIAQTYFWPSEAIANFTFAWSSNGVAFTSITPIIVNTPSTGKNWRRVQYTLNLPAGANYVRVVFPASGRTWNPEVGSVTLVKP